ncbi:hypothetical protein B0H11DRAFT_1196807 [Mycena galericulata]|nr:hypothetical protein B0H11DRAFT_1196807 [Mycena galericulata]
MSVIEHYQDVDPPFDIRDRRALIEYHSKLEAARNLAELNGLESGLRFTLDLTLPPPNPLPRARSLPQFPPQSHVSFLLDQALQSGAGKNSQVWTAVAEVAGTQTTVVFKIIQPSMCEYPEADGCWQGNYLFPEDLAREEAWVYDRLVHKQGLSIPYFFGLHTIVTPSKEAAWVLVLEHILGESLLAFSQSSTRCLSDTCDVLKLSIDTLSDFMADGWCHNDIAPRNIVVTGSPGARSVVFVDLFFTCRFDAEEAAVQCRGFKRMLFIDIYECLGDRGGEIQRWAIENMDYDVCAPVLPVRRPSR